MQRVESEICSLTVMLIHQGARALDAASRPVFSRKVVLSGKTKEASRLKRRP